MSPRSWASTISFVQCVAFAVPLLPGQTEASLIALASCRDGPRKEAFEDALRRAGIVREAVWIQPWAGGHLTVVYLEADDLATAFALLGTSTQPFDRWFRDHVCRALEIKVDDGFSSPELVLDVDLNRIWPSPPLSLDRVMSRRPADTSISATPDRRPEP